MSIKSSSWNPHFSDSCYRKQENSIWNMSEVKPETEHVEHRKDEKNVHVGIQSIPSLDADGKPLEVSEVERPKLLSKHLIPLYCCCLIVYFCSTMNGFDGSLMGSIYTLPDYLEYYDLDMSSTGTGLIVSIYYVGQIVGAFFCSLMDWKGRKVAILTGCFGACIGAVITAVAKDTKTLIGGRFFLSFCTTIAVAAAPAYCVEISPSHLRGTVAGLYNTLWYVGSLVAAFTAYGADLNYRGSTKSFKLPLWLQIIFPAIVVLFGWLIPESPRWLVGVKRIDEARKIIAKYHCNGDENHPLVDLEIAEMIDSFNDVKLSDPIKVLDMRPLVTKRSDRYRLGLVIAMSWFGQFSGNNVASYYLPTMLNKVGMTSASTNVLMNGIYSLVCWFASILGSFSHDKVGRRKMFMFSTIGASLMLSGLAICTARYNITPTQAASTGTLVFIYLFGVIFSFAFTPMQPIYPSEVSSNILRSRSMIVLYVTSGIASFVNQFSAPKAMENIGYWYYVFFVFWDIFEFVIIYFFFVETRHKSLEELEKIFEAKNPRKVSVGNYSDEDEKIEEVEVARQKHVIALTNQFVNERLANQDV